MGETLVQGAGPSGEEQFVRWREMACASHSPHEMSTDHLADFHATMSVRHLGPLQLSAYTAPRWPPPALPR